ncbi:hypothetical protein BJV78DRAFT_277495 [Lactifluus subvellereus]|nr:hypothetical protein BJV78DRAFT_277495 [Lactifluus subvellereus]
MHLKREARFTTDTWTTISEAHSAPPPRISGWRRRTRLLQPPVCVHDIPPIACGARRHVAPSRSLFCRMLHCTPVGKWETTTMARNLCMAFWPARSTPTLATWAGPAIMNDAPFLKAVGFPHGPLVMMRRAQCDDSKLVAVRCRKRDVGQTTEVLGSDFRMYGIARWCRMSRNLSYPLSAIRNCLALCYWPNHRDCIALRTFCCVH